MKRRITFAGITIFILFTVISILAGSLHREFYNSGLITHQTTYQKVTDALIPRFSHATFLVFGFGLGFITCFALTFQIFKILSHLKKTGQIDTDAWWKEKPEGKNEL